MPPSAAIEFISLHAQRNEPKKRALSTGPSGCPRSAVLGRVGQTRLPGSADLNRPSGPIHPSRPAPLGGLEGGLNTTLIGAGDALLVRGFLAFHCGSGDSPRIDSRADRRIRGQWPLPQNKTTTRPSSPVRDCRAECGDAGELGRKPNSGQPEQDVPSDRPAKAARSEGTSKRQSTGVPKKI